MYFGADICVVQTYCNNYDFYELKTVVLRDGGGGGPFGDVSRWKQTIVWIELCYPVEK